MKFACTRCRTPVTSSDVNPHTKIARCSACAHAFIPPALPVTVPAPEAPAQRAWIEVIERAGREGRAPGYRGAHRRPAELVVRHRWGPSERPYSAAMSCLIGLICLPIFPWFLLAETFSVRFLLRRLLVLLVYITGEAAVRRLGRVAEQTVIKATPLGLSFRRGVPWLGRRALASSEVERVACEAVASGSSPPSPPTFAVKAVLNGGGRVALLTGLADRDQATAVARLLEDHLGLAGARVEDRPEVEPGATTAGSL
ncbi:MAG TPA: hypothetical protein VFS43_16110 [Polyangiaceae bacterium]|nr:hypothetical protein [Polyangiaceae bacterium]